MAINVFRPIMRKRLALKFYSNIYGLKHLLKYWYVAQLVPEILIKKFLYFTVI